MQRSFLVCCVAFGEILQFRGKVIDSSVFPGVGVCVSESFITAHLYDVSLGRQEIFVVF